MAEGKESIIVYRDWRHTFNALSDEDAGKLIKHFFAYVNDENPENPDGLVGIAWIQMQVQLKKDLKKWEGIVERNRINGAKGGRPRKPKKPTGLSGNPKKPKKADNDNDNDKEVYIQTLTPEEFKEHVESRYGEGTIDLKKLWMTVQAWQDNGWVDFKGNPIKNLKAKITNVAKFDEYQKKSPYKTPKLS